jgi:hypothetical protein
MPDGGPPGRIARWAARSTALAAVTVASLFAIGLPLGSPAQATGSGIWSNVSPPNPGLQAGLGSISCVSAMFCVGVGSYEDNSGNTESLIEEWNGSSWSTMSPPALEDYNPLHSVSCVSVTFCMGVGSSTTSTDTETLSEEWNGTSWSSVATTNPVANNSTLNAVSCASSSFCMAVGFSQGTGLLSSSTISEEWNGSSWVTEPTTSPDSYPSSDFAGVSCTSSSFCMAVGFSSTNGAAESFTQEWNGSSWVTVPTVAASSLDTFNAVSCTSSSFCIAVGTSSNGTNSENLAEEWNGSSWSLMTPADPYPYNYFYGVSCTSSSFCMIVGSEEAGANTPRQTFAEDWNDSSWTTMATTNVNGDDALDGVSCPSSNFCMAVGYSDGSGYPPVAEIYTSQPPTSLAATPAVLQESSLTPELVDLTATLTNALTSTPIPGEPIAFTAGTTTLCTATTNANGVASCNALGNVSDVAAVVGSDGYTVSFAGDANYLPSSGSAGLIG